MPRSAQSKEQNIYHHLHLRLVVEVHLKPRRYIIAIRHKQTTKELGKIDTILKRAKDAERATKTKRKLKKKYSCSM